MQKEENNNKIFERNIIKETKNEINRQLQLKEDIKKEVDALIYKSLSINFCKHHYKGYMHKKILEELLQDLQD